MSGQMTPSGKKGDYTWRRVFQSNEHFRDIMWQDLLDIAQENWNFVANLKGDRKGTNAQMKLKADYEVEYTGQCLVAALLVPSTAGAYIFLSTVPGGDKRAEMRSKGYQVAPSWWKAVQRTPNVYCHAEDAVEYDLEQAFRSNALNVRVKIVNDKYVVEDRDNPLGPIKIAVWGCFDNDPEDVQRTGRLVELCHTTSTNKVPHCRKVAETLNIEYCTAAKLQAEKRAGSRSSSRASNRPTSSGRDAQKTSKTSPLGTGSTSSAGSRSATAGTNSSASVQGKAPAKKETPYWTYDSKKKKYYHKHKDGKVSWSNDGK